MPHYKINSGYPNRKPDIRFCTRHESGGVFQNRLLLELTDHMLLEQGFEVLKHQLLPPNDGGIALGQAVYAMAYLEKSIETKTI